MPRNIEIKARVTDLNIIADRLKALHIKKSAVIRQADIFFENPQGRLKLRRFSDHSGELIFYQRSDLKGPKTSIYDIYRTTDPAGLEKILRLAYPVLGEVEKTRDLYLTGPTRIHLDRVAGLGNFLELEVVMENGQPAEAGEQIARDLMRKLGVNPENCLEGAYIDLLTGSSATD
jgi:predicted adenylyl cyclase CyaB